MHGGAGKARPLPSQTDLWWDGKIVGRLHVRLATLEAADRGRDLHRALGLLLVNESDARVITKLGIHPITVRCDFLSEYEYIWHCHKAADYMRAQSWPRVRWIA